MCQQILSDELNMRRIATKFVPMLLSNDQTEHRVAIFSELNRPKTTPTSSAPSLLVMNLGFTDTTLRRSSSHLSGRRQIHRD
jgi:hypothetical protein